MSEAYNETTKIVLYGKYGTRKTLQIGHLIDMVGPDRVTILSAEKGLNTIASKITAKNVIEVDNKKELRDSWERVSKLGIDDWLCVDGASNIFNWTLNEHAAAADRYYDAMATGKQPAADDRVAGRFMSDKSQSIDMQKVYGRVGRDLELFIQEAVRLNCNQYWTFLEDMTGSNGREKTIPYGPDVPGKVALRAIMSKFDYVGRLEYDGAGKLICGFDPTSGFYMARTRNDEAAGVKIPAKIDNFNLADFYRGLKP